MKAIICTKYGPPEVLQFKEVEKPVPKDNELLIKIYTTTVTTGDCELRSFKFTPSFWLPLRIMFGIIKPRNPIFGFYFSGKVEAVGKNVKNFKAGDSVFGSTELNSGTYAEYVAIPETGFVDIKSKSISDGEAVTIPIGGIESLHFLRKGNIKSGQKVLINGAGGSIGTYGVQIAKYYGAEVTAVDSADKFEMLQSIGADHCIDYIKEDFSKRGQTYDIIFDIVGKSSFSGSIRSLKKNGFYLISNPNLTLMIRGLWESMISSKKVITAFTKYRREDLIFLSKLVEDGKIKVIIDRNYNLEEIPEAHKYIEKGHKKGNVVITIT